MTKVKAAGSSVRHIPKRTCIACRKTSAKKELVRLVCLPGGNIEVDITGKKSGRGAYLCPSAGCWENAFANGRLEYALRTSVKPEDKERLVNYAKGINNTIETGRS